MATLFSDDFNRTTSNTVGNGWTEVESSSSNFRISGNELLMQGSIGAASDTRMYQSLSQQNAVKITFDFRWDDSNSGNHYFGVVTKSDGSFGSGVGLRFEHPNESVDVKIVDDNTVKSSTTFGFVDNTWYEVELIINSDYSIEVRIWAQSGGSRPTTATLSEAAFTPTSSGTNQAIFRTQSSNSRNVFLDNWLVEGVPAAAAGGTARRSMLMSL